MSRRAPAIGAVLVALAAAAMPSRALADSPPEGEALVGKPHVDQFLDTNYLGPRFSSHAEKNGFDLFEAQIAPHFFFYQWVDGLLRPHEGWHHWNGWSLVFVPLFRLRMTTSSSNPVRTPSANPQFVTIQKFFTWGSVRSAVGPGWVWPTEGGWVGMLGIQYTIAHHSNGQDGCTFVGTGTVDPNCAPADFSHGVPPVNTLNGNYGTNYETLGVHHKWFQLDRDQREHQAHEAGLSWERYEGTAIAWFLPGGFDNSQGSLDLQRIFGKHRVTGHYEYERALSVCAFERLRARGELTGISPASNVSWKGRAMAETALLFRDAGGFGMFGRLFYGQDYYNIRLQDVGFMAIVGFTWELRPLQVFHAGSAPITSGTQQPPTTDVTSGSAPPPPTTPLPGGSPR